MPRQNPALALAAAEQHRDDGMGPIYRHLLTRETDADRRYRALGRPRLLLEALISRETVEVDSWRVPLSLRPARCGPKLVVTPDM